MGFQFGVMELGKITPSDIGNSYWRAKKKEANAGDMKAARLQPRYIP